MRTKHQPVKVYRPGLLTDTGTMNTTIAIQDEAGHVLECHK